MSKIVTPVRRRERWIPAARTGFVLLALLASSTICFAIYLSRERLWHEHKFAFLPWNLALAWIPMLAALGLHRARAGGSRHWPLFVGCGLVWFFFYPNAPYLVTDLVHLKTRDPVPRWFDIILLMSFAWTGLSLGCVSLHLMQEVVRNWLGRVVAWLFVIGMLALGAVGVFVGRFWRWNSWEVLHPRGLASKAADRLEDMPPRETVIFCVIFFAFSLLIYITCYAQTHLHYWAEDEKLRRVVE